MSDFIKIRWDATSGQTDGLPVLLFQLVIARSPNTFRSPINTPRFGVIYMQIASRLH
jgi:hypothetical protein